MSQPKVYNSKTIFALLAAFGIIFSLLYYLAITLHQTQKINAEIESIRQDNKKLYQEILQKKRKLEYLKTAERIDKDAKTQIGKKQPNERSITFIKKEPLPTTQFVSHQPPILPPILQDPNTQTKYYVQDWYELLFTNEVSLTSLTKKTEWTR
ncbi:hypothetical protein CSB37_00285 [bacterium DOLZORAL124_38_8]|nr:MAG: hypothetical protein CSB37_00285 [bacterium DOLZORAL124_38_8]